MSESRTEYKLKSPPEDGITNVTFGPNSSQVSRKDHVIVNKAERNPP